MSKSPTKRHYWDSCLFLDLINATPKRHEIIEALWDELIKTERTIIAVTSTLTIAEVAFAASERKIADPAILAKIDSYWSPESPIEMIELYTGVAHEARSMIREAVAQGHTLKAHDAIHFATAKKRGASVFWTYDAKLLKFDGQFGFDVKEPESQTLMFARTP